MIDQLQSSLGGAYTITRELGGGGMSRVFVAEDTALGRSVVIKVLHPELAAGVNVERFKREVQLSARLQHPHIVPVLTAGEVDGLPYYVMPFVRGESLRARIARGPLPPAEVKGLLADVAKALAAAHDEGVVHRDIKPDNILVSGGAATVADFGIAKALSSARSGQDGEALTSLGTSLGTPAYMAPEQVAGDPNVDHRADIYSLGCVGYELLTGVSPFAGKSPQQMLAAQVLESPVPVNVRQPDVPPSLAAVIMRCLEKDPSKRPQTATELAAEVDAALTGPTAALPTPAVKRRVSPAWIAAAVVGVAALSFFGYRVLNRPAVAASGINLAVAPFEVLDPQLALWREGIVDVLSRNLDGAGPIRAISPSVSIKKWEGRADRTSAMAFGKRLGAELVLYGQLQGGGKDIVDAKVWILDTKSDAMPVEIGARDSVSRMDRLSDSLSLRLLTAIGRTRTIGAAKLSSIGSGSLPAIRAFLQGTQYFRRTQWDSAVVALKEAVAQDSTFGIAYAMLGQAYGWSQGASAEGSRENYVKAGEHIRPGLSTRDSLLLTAIKHYTAGNSSGDTRAAEYRQAYAAGEAETRQYPDDPEGWYFLADMKYHTDRNMTESGALALFDQAIRADSDFAPAYIHAIELAYRRGPEFGRRYTDAYLSRNPRDNQAEGIRLAARLASGTMSAAEVKAVLDTVSPNVAQKATAPLTRLPDSAESVVQILRAAVRRAPNGQGARTALAVFLSMRGHIDESWKLLMEQPNMVAGEFVAVGLLSPDSAMKTVGTWIDRRNDASFAALPALAAGRDTAQLAKIAANLEKAIRPEMPAQQRAGMGYFIQASRAYGALARGDSAAATRAFDALPESTFTIPVDQFIRARLVAKTDPRRAQQLLERATSANDLLYSARALEHARLSEKLGDTQKAVDSYAFVAAIWQNTDSPLLRTAVQEAHDALKRLDSDGRLRAELRKR